VVATPKQNEH